jgi:hypothetical protein
MNDVKTSMCVNGVWMPIPHPERVEREKRRFKFGRGFMGRRARLNDR